MEVLMGGEKRGEKYVVESRRGEKGRLDRRKVMKRERKRVVEGRKGLLRGGGGCYVMVQRLNIIHY